MALVGFASFMGGLLVTSRMLQWLALLMESVKNTSGDGGHERSLVVLVPLVFHSGPWTLLCAAVAMYYVAQPSESVHLVGAYVGFGLAAALILAASLVSLLRQRYPRPEAPLTQERLLAIRRRFFWGNSLFFATVFFAGSFFMYGFTPKEAPGFAVLFFLVGFFVGWFWCWFMWQWYGAALQVREKQRKQREAGNAV